MDYIISAFLKLTYYDGTPFRIRPELIENYGFEDKNNANAYISTANGSYQVKNTVEEIDEMFSPPKMIEPEKDWR